MFVQSHRKQQAKAPGVGGRRRSLPNQPARVNVPDVGQTPASGGRGLSPELAKRASVTFGEDFSAVRVHSDGRANALAGELSAKAFTAGRDLYFGAGKFQPKDGEGLRLLGHELAHVAQQRRGVDPARASDPRADYEREADLAAQSFVLGERAPLRHGGATSIGLQMAPIQREGEGEDKGEAPPVIHASVGKDGVNDPEDVKVVQRLLGLEPTGTADRALIVAIKAFQADELGFKRPDGLIELPGDGDPKSGTTWRALVARASGATVSAPTGPRTRKEFSNKQSIVLGRAKKPGDSAKKTKEVDDIRAAVNNASGYVGHEVTNVAGGTRVLEDYYDSQVSISTLLISSHGGYDSPWFRVGDEYVEPGKTDKIAPWRNLLTDDTHLFVDACHVGGGADPVAGKQFTKELADTLDVTVYTSQGWATWNSDKLDEGTGSWFGKPDTWKAADMTKKPEAFKNMGLYYRAQGRSALEKQYDSMSWGIGGLFDRDEFIESKSQPETINTPIFHSDGTFDISDTRFPGWSQADVVKFWGRMPELEDQ